MKYNRALDYTALSLNELRKGNHALAAKLLAKAAEQTDLIHGIQILEASNKKAFEVEAKAKVAASAKMEEVTTASKQRLKANEEEMEEEHDEEVEQNPLDEIIDEDEEEAEEPAEQMASVLAKMIRRSGAK